MPPPTFVLIRFRKRPISLDTLPNTLSDKISLDGPLSSSCGPALKVVIGVSEMCVGVLCAGMDVVPGKARRGTCVLVSTVSGVTKYVDWELCSRGSIYSVTPDSLLGSTHDVNCSRVDSVVSSMAFNYTYELNVPWRIAVSYPDVVLDRRRQYRNTPRMIAKSAIPPTTPPAMGKV